MSYGNNSPYSSSGTPRPVTEDFAYMYTSPTPTPSPHHYPDYSTPHRRPATRASHVRSTSSAYPDPTFRPPTASPRYKSTGEYATINGGAYYSTPSSGFRDAAYETTSSRRPSSGKHSRRSSMSTPQKERSSASPWPTPSKSKKPVATEDDRKAYKIPTGYSMKNWDPTETPILLLGSVFDANSLGKWIYDWTANVYGPGAPMADVAGELWLLLIQLYGKVARMEKVSGRVRNRDDRDTIDEFLEAGDRLTRKFQEILKTCEAPMLKASRSGGAGSLGSSSGVEFVNTFFGKGRKLKETENFMQGVRTFNLRFDVNCESIVRNPTK